MSERRRARAAHEVAFGELPEITRGLRALGSPRHSGTGGRAGPVSALHAQFFHPLLDARRRAAGANPDAAVRAFDAPELTRSAERIIDKIVAEWPDARPPARRALRTALRERTGDYFTALERLRDHAARVLSADEASRLERWREWTLQLVATFQAADRGWLALRGVIENLASRAEG